MEAPVVAVEEVEVEVEVAAEVEAAALEVAAEKEAMEAEEDFRRRCDYSIWALGRARNRPTRFLRRTGSARSLAQGTPACLGSNRGQLAFPGRSAAADDERHSEASRLSRSGLRALADDAADEP